MNINGYNIYYDFFSKEWNAVSQTDCKSFENVKEALNYCKGEK